MRGRLAGYGIVALKKIAALRNYVPYILDHADHLLATVARALVYETHQESF